MSSAAAPNGNAIRNSSSNVNEPEDEGFSIVKLILLPYTVVTSIQYFYQFVNSSPLNHGNHAHEKKCPITGQPGEHHAWRAPSSNDSRSVCPALNTLANHGYIARDGKHLSATQIAYGLKACYGLSTGLAFFLSFVGIFLIRFPYPFSLRALHSINKHWESRVLGVEHDASLVHDDAPSLPASHTYLPKFVARFCRNVGTDNLAPNGINQDLVQKFENDVKPHPFSFWYNHPTRTQSKLRSQGNSNTPEAAENSVRLVTTKSVAVSRVRREKESHILDPVHAEIARGEMGIILGVWEQEYPETKEKGTPLSWVTDWLVQNRLPSGWKGPDHIQKLHGVVNKSKEIRKEMERLRGKEQ